MKNKIKFILPFILLCSCNEENVVSSSSSVSDDASNSSSSVSSSDSKVDVSFKLENVVDGLVSDASFSINGSKVEATYINGTYSIAGVELNSQLEITHPRYMDKIVTISSSSLSTISMEYPYVDIGSTRYCSNYLANDWSLSSTRSMDALCFRFYSPHNRFLSSNSVLKFFLSSGVTSSSLHKGDYEFRMSGNNLFVYDYGFVHSKTDLSIFDYKTTIDNDTTTLYLSIPYSYIKIKSNDIVGVTMSDYLLDSDIETDMVFDDVTINNTNPKEFTRIDVKGRAFVNSKNEDNPYWVSKAMKASLIKGKDYSFASPAYSNYAAADDFYFSTTYNENLSFDFVGFGEFSDTEYIQLVIHNNIVDKNSWKLVSDDVVIHINKEEVKIYNNCSEFFSVQNKQGTLLETIKLSTYINYGPYFTLNVSIPVSSIPNITSSYDDIYLMAVEFNGTTLYDGKNYYENFFYKGVTRGDPADMISYVCIDAPEKRISSLTNEEKKALIGSRAISFANPDDTKFDKADDFYLSVTRNEASFNFDMVGFGDFSSTEIITFVFHYVENDGKEWAIQNEDVTFMVSQKQIKITNNTTDFWVGTRITRGIASSSTPNYERKESYFTLSFDVPYSEISSSITSSSEMRMYAFEFGFGGVMYNSEPWNRLMRYQGSPCGDPAFQANYISI